MPVIGANERVRTLLLLGGATTAPIRDRFATTATDANAVFRLTFTDSAEAKPFMQVVPAGTMTVPRHSIAYAELSEGQFLIVGGSEDGAPTDRAELYDVNEERFTPLCEGLVAPREGCVIVEAEGGAWLIVGGDGPDAENNVEIFYWRP